MPIYSIVFRLCKDRRVCKHKISSPIDEKIKDPAHRATNKTDEKNSFCGEVHCETYAALLHHNLPKTKTILQLRQSKVAKTETATGNNTCDQCYILAHSAYAERRGSCKIASFSDVKLKVP